MAFVKPSRSELPFASIAAYSPRGETPLAIRSRALMLQVKEVRVVVSAERLETAAEFVARRLREISPTFLEEFLGPAVGLVPVPRSGLQRPGALWPANEIALALRQVGFGSSVLPCLSRTKAVPKAATSRASERPKARAHFDSLQLRSPLELPSKVTLVDDVVTRGAQLFGAAWRIWAARPDAEVRAFSVIRTISDPDEFTSIGAPCEGRITWRNEDCRREP